MLTLPFRWIPLHVQDSNYDDEIRLEHEIHRIGKSLEKRSPDTSAEVLVVKRAALDAIIGSFQLIEKFRAKPRLLAIVQVKRGGHF